MKLISYKLDKSQTQSGRQQGRYRRLTILLLVLIGFATVVGILTPAGLGWDFANFYDTGRRAAAWQIGDLYKPESLIAGVQPQGKLSFWGAPISALFYAPLSLFSAERALAVFKLQNAAACLAALWLLYRNNRRFFYESVSPGRWRFAALFSALVLIYQPFWTIYRVGGQTTPTVFLLFAVGLFYHTREQFRLSAVCLALALLIKPAFVLVLLPLCLVSGWKFLREILVVFMVFGLASVFILGWDVHAEFVEVLFLGMTKSFPWLYNSSLFVTAENLKLLAEPPIDARMLGIPVMVVKASLILLFGRLFWLSRKEDWPIAARRQFDFLMSVIFCLMISQTVWEHYLAVLFLPLAYLAAINRTLTAGARILLTSIFVASIGQNIMLILFVNTRINLDSIPELIVIGLLKSSPLWLMLLFLLKYRQEFFQSFLHPEWTRLTERS